QTAPSLDDFARLAREAFDALPEPFRSLAGDVVIRVDDFADEATLEMMEIEDPFELTGLYHGVDIGLRAGMGPAPEARRIFLARPPPDPRRRVRGGRRRPVRDHRPRPHPRNRPPFRAGRRPDR